MYIYICFKPDGHSNLLFCHGSLTDVFEERYLYHEKRPLTRFKDFPLIEKKSPKQRIFCLSRVKCVDRKNNTNNVL